MSSGPTFEELMNAYNTGTMLPDVGYVVNVFSGNSIPHTSPWTKSFVSMYTRVENGIQYIFEIRQPMTGDDLTGGKNASNP